MWPQKWKASAFCALSAAATNPLPLTARRSLPARARNPRRELRSATVSLSTHWAGCANDQALELVERVERPLREQVAVRREDERVGASRDREPTPGIGVGLLVEELELDLRIGGHQAQARLERLAESAARGSEDRDRERGASREAVDHLEPAAERRAL